MEKRIKRVISFVIVLVMVFSSIPFSVIAQTTKQENLITQSFEEASMEIEDNDENTGEDNSGNNSNNGDTGEDKNDNSEQTVVAKSLRLNLQSRGGIKQYAPHGYSDKYCLMLNYGSRYSLGTYNLIGYEKLEIKYATDASYIAQQEDMAQPAFFALCKESNDIGLDGIGYADKPILHEDKILAKADCEDAYITNPEGTNWDKNERTATIDLSDVDYNGEVTLFHFNSTGNAPLVVEIILYANGDDTVEDETDIVWPETNKPAEPSREVDFFFWNDNITHTAYDRINEIYVSQNQEFKERPFLLSGVNVAVFDGWVGSTEVVSRFSYSINNGPKQAKTEFLVEAEQAVIDAAATTGAVYAYRFNVSVPVSEGSQLVKIFVEFENGDYEIIWISELTIGEATAYDPGENRYIKETPIDDFRYTIADEQVTIDEYLGSAKEVIIPAVIEGYPVTIIGRSAFFDKNSLINVVIPEGIISIGENAFFSCESLTRVEIPDSVESIGGTTFSYAASLTGFTISENNAYYSCVDGVLFNKDKTKLICCPAGKGGEYIVPDGVTNIGYGAFDGCLFITEIRIPAGVVSIEAWAFGTCRSLKSITIPNSVTDIGYNAFYNCDSLNHIFYIGTETEWNMEYGNSFADMVIHCDVEAGAETAMVENEATCTVGKNILHKCTYCDVVFDCVEEGNSLGHNYVEGICELCGLSEDFPLSYEFNDGEIEITGCFEDTKIVTIPDTIEGYPVTSIGDYVFSYCSSLTRITIPNSITDIGYDAFYECDSLNHIFYIGTETEWNMEYGNSFADMVIHCDVEAGAETAMVENEATCTVGKNILHKCTYCDVVFDCVEEENSLGHNYVEGICELCGLSEDFELSYEFNNGKIEITDCKEDATIIVVPDTIEGYPVTSIGDYAFSNCSSLTNITIPNSVNRIGNSAFSYCSSLKSITIPEGVTSIGNDTFSWCSLLDDITIPEGVISIGDWAFCYCISLTDITIPKSIRIIGCHAFDNCISLTNITIPEEATSIGEWAFADCSLLTRITICKGVTNIGEGAFSWCYELNQVYYTGTETEWNIINIEASGNKTLLDAKIFFNCVPGEAVDMGTDFIAQIITGDNKQVLGVSGIKGALVQPNENNRGQLYYFVRQADGSYKIIHAKTSYILGWQDEAIAGSGINLVPEALNNCTWIVQFESGKCVLKASYTESLVVGISNGSVQLVELTTATMPMVLTVNRIGDADYEVPTTAENGVLTDAEISTINNLLCEVSDDCKNMGIAELNQKISEYASKSFELGVVETKAIALCINILSIGGDAELERVLAKTNDYSIEGIYAALLTDTGTQVGAYRARNWEFYKSCVTAEI